jgi:hypothetical protein
LAEAAIRLPGSEAARGWSFYFTLVANSLARNALPTG